ELPPSLDNAIFLCDKRWHTLKFLSDDPSDRYDVYLDGRLIVMYRERNVLLGSCSIMLNDAARSVFRLNLMAVRR
ncbi:MAG: hypothetical protein SVR94_20115, partial [Pseudomonadota bacterium]|nr:hypothetical protein [Pseudomonadota bacterium]